MSTPELVSYIQGQLQSGLDANTIASQLRSSGWQEQDIQVAFQTAQQQLTPTPVIVPASVVTAVQLPQPLQQSRIKTGWQLFKQSLAIIKNNPGLSRYVIVSTVWVLVLFIIFAAVFVVDYMHQQILSFDDINHDGTSTISISFIGYAVLVVWVFIQTVITFYYATGLSTHVLAIFHGKQTTYGESMVQARTKIGPIISFSVINVIVVVIISTLQRIRFIGWIISKLLDIAWSLASAFAIPLIADKKISGIGAAKESLQLFKANWGPTIVSRISLGGAFFLVYFLVAVPLTIVLGIGLSLIFGIFGLISAGALFILSLIVVGVIQTLATNILNVGLYYYATYKVIPPNFSPELLASVFREKRKK